MAEVTQVDLLKVEADGCEGEENNSVWVEGRGEINKKWLRALSTLMEGKPWPGLF